MKMSLFSLFLIFIHCIIYHYIFYNKTRTSTGKKKINLSVREMHASSVFDLCQIGIRESMVQVLP